ncbi:hypothetical protein MMC25_002708 [Agyrium rufum]|nr:hypothetical protein [Agyrium rufum]
MLLLTYVALMGAVSLVAANPLQIRQDSSSTTITSSASLSSASASASAAAATTDSDLVPSTVSYPSSTSSTTSAGGILSTTLPSIVPIPNGQMCTTADLDKSINSVFCEPTNGSTKYPNERYYVTWDPTKFANDSQIIVYVDYTNPTENEGANAWQSPTVYAAQGFVIMETDSAWLQGQKANFLTFSLSSYSLDNAFAKYPGPIVNLTNVPANHLPPQSGGGRPNKLGLLLGLPIGLGVMAIVLGGLYFGMRHHRRISLKEVLGRNSAGGYGVRKSRRQRMGKKGPIQITDEGSAVPHGDEYKDDYELQQRSPNTKAGHERDISLGSLAGSPTREEFGSRPQGGNAFRDEISRQEQGR